MSSRLARSAGLISLATMASRLLGVVRETVVAAIFGAGTQMDAFNVAFRVPNLLRDLFAEGAMTAAFIPTFTRTMAQQGREAAWRLGNLVINTLLIATGGFVVIGIVLAGPITNAIAAGFAEVPGKLELTADLTRVMLPFLTTVAVAVAAMGMLNSLNRFFIPSLSPAMFNIVTIICAIGLVPIMPRFGMPGITALAIATLLGGVAQIGVQWPLLRKEGFRYQPIVDFKDPALREVLRLMIPGTLGLAAVQINIVVNTYLASGQPEGAVSWLQYAFRLMYLPIGLFGVSVATAAVPEIARHSASDDLPSIRRTVSSAVRMILMLNLPATIGLIVLAEPVVTLIFERGRFLPSDTAATAAALMFYAPGLIGYSAVKIASPTFYSLGDSRTPVIVSVLSVAVNLALNLALVRVLGFKGLALGTAIAALFNAIVLLWLLRRRLGGLDERRIAIAFLKIGAASLAMAVAAWLAYGWLERLVTGTGEVRRAVRVFGAIGIALVTLVAGARLLRIWEFGEAYNLIARRLLPARR